jgi:hypothetical protein
MPLPDEVEIVADPTDSGNHRPALPSEHAFGTSFEPMICPNSDRKISLLPIRRVYVTFGAPSFPRNNWISLFKIRVFWGAYGLAGIRIE